MDRRENETYQRMENQTYQRNNFAKIAPCTHLMCVTINQKRNQLTQFLSSNSQLLTSEQAEKLAMFNQYWGLPSMYNTGREAKGVGVITIMAVKLHNTQECLPITYHKFYRS